MLNCLTNPCYLLYNVNMGTAIDRYLARAIWPALLTNKLVPFPDVEAELKKADCPVYSPSDTFDTIDMLEALVKIFDNCPNVQFSVVCLNVFKLTLPGGETFRFTFTGTQPANTRSV